MPSEKLLLAYNGVEADAFSPGDGSTARAKFGIAEDALVLGIFSILNPFKGQAILLRAMLRILEAVPNAHLLIVGGGEMRGELEALAASLHLEQHVTFTGYQKDTLPLYRAIDLYMMASVIADALELLASQKPPRSAKAFRAIGRSHNLGDAGRKSIQRHQR